MQSWGKIVSFIFTVSAHLNTFNLLKSHLETRILTYSHVCNLCLSCCSFLHKQMVIAGVL